MLEREKRRLCCELANYQEILKRAYEGKSRKADYIAIQKTYDRYSTVEETAIKICDKLREPVEELEAMIAGQQAIIDDVMTTLDKAGAER